MVNTTEDQGQSRIPREHEDTDRNEKSYFPWIQKYLDLADLLIRRNRPKGEIKKPADKDKAA